MANETLALKAENNDAVLASVGATITDAFKWKLTSDGKLLSLADETLDLNINLGDPVVAGTPSYYYYYTDVCVREVANMAFDRWSLILATGMCLCQSHWERDKHTILIFTIIPEH